MNASMEFITISQYFYKLYNVLLLVLLIPIFAFIFIYVWVAPVDFHSYLLWPYRIGLTTLVAVDWLVMLFFHSKKMKSIRNDQGLRTKLEKYFQLTIVRYTAVGFGCILLAVGFYLIHDDFITGLFALNLISLGFLWPTASKVCNELKLRGDEREMVYYKKDSF
jgi:hypothetical protein